MIKLVLLFFVLYLLYRFWIAPQRVNRAKGTPCDSSHRFDISKVEDADFREVGPDGESAKREQ